MVVAWLFWFGRCGFPQRRLAAALLSGGVAVSLVLGSLYFVGYVTPTWNPPNPGPIESLYAGARILSYGFGATAMNAPRLFVVLTFLLFSATLLLVWISKRNHQPARRFRLLGAAWFAATAVAFAFAVGWGRAGWVPLYGLPSRYALLVVPAFVALLLVWDDLPGAASRWLSGGFALVLLVLLPLNERAGETYFGRWYRNGTQAVQAELQAGTPFRQIAERHGAFLMPSWSIDVLAQHMTWLRTAGVAPFAQRPSDTPSAPPRGL